MKWNLVTPILDILIQLLDTHTIQIKLKIYWQELINLKHLKLKYLLKFKIKLFSIKPFQTYISGLKNSSKLF
jgi:hypothetical protein